MGSRLAWVQVRRGGKWHLIRASAVFSESRGYYLMGCGRELVGRPVGLRRAPKPRDRCAQCVREAAA